jgi:hypothetical protein
LVSVFARPLPVAHGRLVHPDVAAGVATAPRNRRRKRARAETWIRRSRIVIPLSPLASGISNFGLSNRPSRRDRLTVSLFVSRVSPVPLSARESPSRVGVVAVREKLSAVRSLCLLRSFRPGPPFSFFPCGVSIAGTWSVIILVKVGPLRQSHRPACPPVDDAASSSRSVQHSGGDVRRSMIRGVTC